VRYYYCVITNTDATATGNQTATITSDAVTVTVNALTNAEIPNITNQPSDIVITVGGTATLSVTASVPRGTLSYQWYESTSKTNSGGTLIAGATSATYIPPTDTMGVRYYYCVITNTDTTATGNQTATITSNAVTVTVNALTNAEIPNITNQPSDIVITVDETAELSVTASVSEGTLSYQWYESTSKTNSDGTLIPGATSAIFSLPTDTTGVRYYYCVITNTDATATGNQAATIASNAVTVTVNALTNAETPNITRQPSDVAITVSGTATLSVTANVSAGTLTCQWFSNTTKTNSGGTIITGATGATYRPPTNTVGVRYYYCVITNTDATVNGNPVSTVTSVAVSVTNQPAPETDTILVNGQPMEAPLGSDGALRITFTREDIARYSGDGDSFNVEVSGHMNIFTFISISSLNGADLRLKTDFGMIFIPNAVLEEISKQHGDMLRLSIRRGSFYLAFLDEHGNEIPYFNPNMPIRLILPYELKEGEKQNAVVAIGKDGKVIPFAVYRNGLISFNIFETGIYYDAVYRKKIFSDVGGHWSDGYIDFLAAREVVIGVGGGRFAPKDTMTRAMFAQILANLDGADLSGYKTSRFTDVRDGAWYMQAVEWAADVGIVQGVGNGKFDPRRPITREQMAVMLRNYIQYKEISLPAVTDAPTFGDENIVSSWALDAVREIRATGIIGGRPGNLFDPKATATRAEVAAIFARFIEVVAVNDDARFAA
jgi:uncharacterized protein YodC (DUF2158 family)